MLLPLKASWSMVLGETFVFDILLRSGILCWQSAVILILGLGTQLSQELGVLIY